MHRSKSIRLSVKTIYCHVSLYALSAHLALQRTMSQGISAQNPPASHAYSQRIKYHFKSLTEHTYYLVWPENTIFTFFCQFPPQANCRYGGIEDGGWPRLPTSSASRRSARSRSPQLIGWSCCLSTPLEPMIFLIRSLFNVHIKTT